MEESTPIITAIIGSAAGITTVICTFFGLMIRHMNQNINQRFDDMNRRFDETNRRLDDTNRRLERVETRVDDVGRDLGELRERVGELRERVSKLEGAIYAFIDRQRTNSQRRSEAA